MEEKEGVMVAATEVEMVADGGDGGGGGGGAGRG